jgi:hypothetical protein
MSVIPELHPNYSGVPAKMTDLEYEGVRQNTQKKFYTGS